MNELFAEYLYRLDHHEQKLPATDNSRSGIQQARRLFIGLIKEKAASGEVTPTGGTEINIHLHFSTSESDVKRGDDL